LLIARCEQRKRRRAPHDLIKHRTNESFNIASPAQQTRAKRKSKTDGSGPDVEMRRMLMGVRRTLMRLDGARYIYDRVTL